MEKIRLMVYRATRWVPNRGIGFKLIISFHFNNRYTCRYLVVCQLIISALHDGNTVDMTLYKSTFFCNIVKEYTSNFAINKKIHFHCSLYTTWLANNIGDIQGQMQDSGMLREQLFSHARMHSSTTGRCTHFFITLQYSNTILNC